MRYALLCEALADRYVVSAFDGIEVFDTPYRLTTALEAAQAELQD